MAKWEPNGSKCPKCDQETETLYSTDAGGYELSEAERCSQCGWIIRFTNEKDEAR